MEAETATALHVIPPRDLPGDLALPGSAILGSAGLEHLAPQRGMFLPEDTTSSLLPRALGLVSREQQVRRRLPVMAGEFILTGRRREGGCDSVGAESVIHM